nr:MAG TPA: hypothetical protein [Caudoviricetes sp.]
MILYSRAQIRLRFLLGSAFFHALGIFHIRSDCYRVIVGVKGDAVFQPAGSHGAKPFRVALRHKADCDQRPVHSQPQFPGNVICQIERINCHTKVTAAGGFLNSFCHRLFLSVKVFPCVFCLHSIQIPIFIFFNPECRKHQRFNIICQTVRFWGIWVGNAQDDTIITYSVYLLPCVFKIGSICNAVFM